MNKYLKRGIVCTIIGVAFGALGLYLKATETYAYGWALILAVLIFGFGFITIIYSLIRKIERRSIIEERQNESEEK